MDKTPKVYVSWHSERPPEDTGSVSTHGYARVSPHLWNELQAARATIERVRALLTSKGAPGMKGRPTAQGDVADAEWREAIKKALGE